MEMKLCIICINNCSLREKVYLEKSEESIPLLNFQNHVYIILMFHEKIIPTQGG